MPPSSTSKGELPSILVNPPVGGGGGEVFNVIGNAISTLEVWTGNWAGCLVLIGLQVTWENGGQSPLLGSKTEDAKRYNFNFKDGERIKSMSISGQQRVDKIQFETNRGSFSAGGNGGHPAPMNVGHGILVGFTGRSAAAMDALGAVFED